ncbi:MAG TPA: UDP-N-acetylmuramate dehydrogenase [Bacillota bacterium]|nr:UDP-N-acetylmuramate dehydrogenase [Bacillota bacterium]
MTDYATLRQYLISESESGELTFLADYPLSALCTFKIGGPADFVVYPKTERALISLVEYARSIGVRYNVFGNASNVLFDDPGYRGVVIFTSELKSIKIDGPIITAGSGMSVTALSVAAYRSSLSGLEFTYGIPGSVGGAVYMNAGAYGGEIKDVCISSRVYNPETGEIEVYSGDEQRFGYRESIYMNSPLIILSSDFRLNESDPVEIEALMKNLMNQRIEKQPLDLPSAGSVFKRCKGYFTAKLIEDSGLKGKSIGGAQVSEKHAGFIVNKGGATASDVLKLIEHIQEEVYRQFGVEIQPEVRFIPAE